MSDPEADRPARTLAAETVVAAPIEAVFDLLVDVPRYTAYSKYLESVAVDGDGGPGTVYRMRFEWWRLSYTAVSRVDAIERPRRIEWSVIEDVDARGAWQLDPIADGEPRGEWGPETTAAVADGPATSVLIEVAYDPGSVTPGVLDLPRFVSLDRVVDRATPLVEREARRVLERLVADLEGDPRAIDLEVRTG